MVYYLAKIYNKVDIQTSKLGKDVTEDSVYGT